MMKKRYILPIKSGYKSMNPAMPEALAPQINTHFNGKFEVELKYRLLDHTLFAALQMRNPRDHARR